MIKNSRGFTITEILAALAIFSVTAVPLTAAFQRLTSDTSIRNKITAVALARKATEELLLRSRLIAGPDTVAHSGSLVAIATSSGSGLQTLHVAVYRGEHRLFDLYTLAVAKTGEP